MSDDRPGPDRHESGAVRYRASTGEWIVVCPGEPLYSTAMMAATEYWVTSQQRWLPLWGNDD